MPKLFADFETSGLDPFRNEPLEFAAVVTDNQLNILAEQSFLIWHSTEEVEELYSLSHYKVAEMHERNGLWEDLLHATGEHSVKVDDFERHVLAFVNEACASAGISPRSLELAGFNPFFDRKWLEVFAPEVLQGIHYRSYDVSTLRTTAQDFGLSTPELGPVPHRSLGDCHSAIQYARWFRGVLTETPF